MPTGCVYLVDDMRIDVHFHSFDESQKLDTIINLLNQVLTKETKIMAVLDDLVTQVAANTDAEQSAVILLNKLHDLLVAAGTDPVKLQALKDQLSASKDALAAAIVANTPAA